MEPGDDDAQRQCIGCSAPAIGEQKNIKSSFIAIGQLRQEDVIMAVFVLEVTASSGALNDYHF